MSPFRAGEHQGWDQSSTRRPVTRLNSFVLLLTKVKLWARQMAAIIKSFGPITEPRSSSSCWMTA